MGACHSQSRRWPKCSRAASHSVGRRLSRLRSDDSRRVKPIRLHGRSRSKWPEALAACRQQRPDAVLLDIGLPGMSGFEVAKQLRDEFGSATPFLVAVTGYGRVGDYRQSAAAGIDVHLVKPVDMNELDRILSTLPNGKPCGP